MMTQHVPDEQSVCGPSRLSKLELDIMNPHYSQYYAGREPPSDSQNPVPVYFLTVPPGTEFRFSIGWREPFGGEDVGLGDIAKGWLVTGLTQLGVGAKTGAGYGYFAPSIERPTAPGSANS